MAALKLNKKKLQIDKANQTIFVVLSVSVFVVIFCGFTLKALLIQRSYQAKVITQKEAALKQLLANVKAADELDASYQDFVGKPTNVIGGYATGQADRDGDNARIVLDALPSKYDFPALVTSLEKILNDPAYNITGITGTDDEIAQTAIAQNGSGAPQPVVIPFSIGVKGSPEAIAKLIVTLEHSIRPIKVTQFKLNTATADDKSLDVSITANTFYQPEKVYTITTKDVKWSKKI